MTATKLLAIAICAAALSIAGWVLVTHAAPWWAVAGYWCLVSAYWWRRLRT